jgi:hypothetical protein
VRVVAEAVQPTGNERLLGVWHVGETGMEGELKTFETVNYCCRLFVALLNRLMATTCGFAVRPHVARFVSFTMVIPLVPSTC